MNKYFYFLRLLESTRFFDADYEARMWIQEFVERGGDIEYELELCREVGVTVAEVFETACPIIYSSMIPTKLFPLRDDCAK